MDRIRYLQITLPPLVVCVLAIVALQGCALESPPTGYRSQDTSPWQAGAHEGDRILKIGDSSTPGATADNVRPELPLIVAKESLPDNWPVFRGNALQTGVAGSKLPDDLEIVWKFTAKDGFEGAACIVNGIVYVGCEDGHLYALDLKTGAKKWEYLTEKNAPIKAPPSYRGGLVYVGDGDGIFHCVDATTGKKRWTFETGGEISSGANFAGDNILFGSGDEQLYCLSKDGKELWKFKVPGGPVMASPAVVGDRTFVAGCDSTLHVLETAKGQELGAIDIDGQAAATAAVVGDRLYLGTMSNEVLAIAWKKPEIAWKYTPEKRQQPFFASAAVTDALVVIGSRDRRVHAIDRKSGQPVWTFQTDNRVDSSPVIVGQRVFAGSLDGKLYVIDLAKGKELKKFDLGGAIAASPAVGDGCLVVGTDKGVLYCLGAKK
jgi:outer membrane protein assembly factor BamB